MGFDIVGRKLFFSYSKMIVLILEKRFSFNIYSLNLRYSLPPRNGFPARTMHLHVERASHVPVRFQQSVVKSVDRQTKKRKSHTSEIPLKKHAKSQSVKSPLVSCYAGPFRVSVILNPCPNSKPTLIRVSNQLSTIQKAQNPTKFILQIRWRNFF